jgi:hypothetical protein
MWFRNRLVNPVVLVLLRSPLHPVLSRSLMILGYQGRKTGRWRSLPCMYARDGQDLYVVPGQPGRKVWWRNLRQPTRVRLHLQGRDLEGIATPAATPRPWPLACAGIWPATPRRPSPSGSDWTPAAPPTARPRPPTRWSWSASTLTAASTGPRRRR